MSNLTLEEKIKRFPVLTYARVCGWLSPTANFNDGKNAERLDRVNFIIDNKTDN